MGIDMTEYIIKHNDDRIYPMGLTILERGIHIEAVWPGEFCSLLLFRPGSNVVHMRIPFPAVNRRGDVWSMTVEGDFIDLEYCFETEAGMKPDPYGRVFTGRETWGDLKITEKILKTPIYQEDFDWEGDTALQIPYEACIVYRLHVRGFTKHSSSQCKDKGTFGAVQEKIPYLKTLGITTLELLPISEFQEVVLPKGVGGNPYGPLQPTGKLNYWGYTESCLMAPKASYAACALDTADTNQKFARCRKPVRELKELVKALHKAGIELVIELYFTGQESPSFVLDTLRFWVREYHVDGIHLTGYAPLDLIGNDSYLSRTKLWAGGWDGRMAGRHRNLAEYNDGFLVDMRRVLKGDEDQVNVLIYRTKRNPKDFGVINYMTHTNGFTMMDLVSYEIKHNDANGENNLDGSNYNYSWNCGMEGPSRKKKLADLRKRQIRNAWLLLLLSQGTPMILAGDEFGNTQNGNNNAYCQDNEISWLNWNQLKSNQDIHDFVQFVIAFRKAHPVFCKKEAPKNLDYLACGHPDVSYHGVRAWYPEFENYRRQLGILYCGEYDRCADGSSDNYFYVAYNMHWESHAFALPNLPDGLFWHVSINTDANALNGCYGPGDEPILKDQRQFSVEPRSIVVFIGKQTDKTYQKESGKTTVKTEDKLAKKKNGKQT